MVAIHLVIYTLDPHPHNNRDLFLRALFLAKRAGFKPETRWSDYKFVSIVPKEVYERNTFGNNGIQAWRHNISGYAFPDWFTFTRRPDAWFKKPLWGPKMKITNVEELMRYFPI